VFIFSVSVCFSQEEAWDAPVSRELGEIAVSGLIASGETLLGIGVLMLFNRFVLRHEWAFPTSQSIHQNFTVPWYWEDTDGFIVNQIGHPYQGSISFTAGRVNGFNFYESMFFCAFGSFVWEAFGESQHASINDFITTATGSMPVGEMLYRLYLEACAAGIPAPLTFFISPMAAFHRLVTKWEPPDTGTNLYSFQAHFGAVYAQTDYTVLNGSQEEFSFRGPVVDVGFKAVYGDPFDQDSRVPFRHFEFTLSIGSDFMNYFDMNIISDGYLFSFSPLYTDTKNLSTGLSLHLDAVARGKLDIYDSTVDMYSNALNWTVKYRYLFKNDSAVQVKSHAGFTFFGVSEYYSPEIRINDFKPPAIKNEIKNYGYGFNSKHFFILEISKKDMLELSCLFYTFWPYPGTSTLSGGNTLWLFGDITYSRFISKHISLGLTNSFVMERGKFTGYPDTRKWNNTSKLFVAWNM
jgi:hypothetical protein